MKTKILFTLRTLQNVTTNESEDTFVKELYSSKWFYLKHEVWQKTFLWFYKPHFRDIP